MTSHKIIALTEKWLSVVFHAGYEMRVSKKGEEFFSHLSNYQHFHTNSFFALWNKKKNKKRCKCPSPLQEAPVGVRNHFLLRLTDEVPLLFVWDGPALLDLTQLLQAVVEALRQTNPVESAPSTDWSTCRSSQLTLNLSLITCRSLSFSCREEKQQRLNVTVTVESELHLWWTHEEVQMWPWFLAWRRAGSCRPSAQWPSANCGRNKWRLWQCRRPNCARLSGS